MNKPFKGYKRSDFINYIYSLEVREEELINELEYWKAVSRQQSSLSDEKTNLVEAAAKINDMLISAQKTADDYVDTVKTSAMEAEQKALLFLKETKEKLLKLAAETEECSKNIRAFADEI